ncbi:nudix hydrolase 2-like [Solanum tuberosum]|uniref:nudix hydrolase 2-like n=1 Tax=Solanum tuberosum TaxID=4113 RepID=UPI0003D25FE1|nr:PREDICTED: nudix hydrolase 2-like [Solanum tuberosum]
MDSFEEASIDIKMEIFEAIEDNYGGVIVNMKKEEPMDFLKFHSMLKASISHWRLKGKKGVWIKLPIELAHLVNAAVKEGFWYHHAEATYLMLVYWIPHEIPHTFPANASHRIGIGAFVFNQDGQDREQFSSSAYFIVFAQSEFKIQKPLNIYISELGSAYLASSL